MTRPAVRGPGSNQHADKPPVAPRGVDGAAASPSAAAVLGDPLADAPPTPHELGDAIRQEVAPAVREEVGRIHRHTEVLAAETQTQDDLVNRWWHASRRAEEAREQAVQLIDRHVIASGGQPVGRFVLPEDGTGNGMAGALSATFERMGGLSPQAAADLADMPTVYMGVASVVGAQATAEGAERRVRESVAGMRDLAHRTRQETESARGRVRGHIHDRVRQTGAEHDLNTSEGLTSIYRQAVSDADRTLADAHEYAQRVVRRTEDRQDEVEAMLRRRY